MREQASSRRRSAQYAKTVCSCTSARAREDVVPPGDVLLQDVVLGRAASAGRPGALSFSSYSVIGEQCTANLTRRMERGSRCALSSTRVETSLERDPLELAPPGPGVRVTPAPVRPDLALRQRCRPSRPSRAAGDRPRREHLPARAGSGSARRDDRRLSRIGGLVPRMAIATGGRGTSSGTGARVRDARGARGRPASSGSGRRVDGLDLDAGSARPADRSSARAVVLAQS